jgi:hypothetical protein|tara:strand:- start:1403 stop:1585 length:183 start_codon:yes stop_codon:yes gene_type:complete
MLDDLEREVWRDALEVAHRKGYASRTRKEIIDRYWYDKLDEEVFDTSDYDECLKLIGGTT